MIKVAERAGLSVVFFVNGFVLATWFARIPGAAQRSGLHHGQLGVALLGMSAGALVAFQASGWLSSRRGSAFATSVFGFGFCAALLLPAIATSLWALFGALVLLGAGNGGMDVAMNAQGLQVERRRGRPVLSSLHGFFSLGGLAGAATGVFAAGHGVSLTDHFFAVAAVAVAVLAAMRPSMVRDLPEPPGDSGARRERAVRLPPRPLWGIGAIAFCGAVAEGAMADWTAIYLRDALRSTTAVAPLGYAAFSATMLIGRFSGDALRGRFTPRRIITTGSVIAAAGLAGGLSVPRPAAAVAGFAIVGLGVSIIAPVAFEAAARGPLLPPARALSAVATMAYTGFLVGPPLLGFVASATSLRSALSLVAVLCAVAAVMATRAGDLRATKAPSSA
ncbi:MFS transporter [Spirillospora sp. CA-142024]|uniref:MFS transporter n=1 Tax=Spirillospora sp. CA-142024 TaxID=3240036 RepID=UPI003D8EEF34